MPTQTSVPPELSPDDKVQFIDFHRPALKSGDYTLTLTQNVTRDETVKGDGSGIKLDAASEGRFSVQGERYALAKQDIHAVYPPDGSVGAWENVLPHIALERSTLPWERSPYGGKDDKTDSPSWMALLLFQGAEIPDITQVKVKISDHEKDKGRDLGSDPNVKWESLPEENVTDPDQVVTVIDVPWSRLKAQLPSYADLGICAHVRTIEYATPPPAGADRPPEMAFVMGNRLPPDVTDDKPVQCVVHLVSLENRYQSSYKFTIGTDTEDTLVDIDVVRLISLVSWKFTCQADKNDFGVRIDALGLGPKQLDSHSEPLNPISNPNSALLRLEIEDANDDAQKYIHEGYLPLPHRLRQGGRTVSWYRGPLLPRLPKGETWVPPLPARHADELLLFDPEIGMFDASYATAWELGRLLALADRKFAFGLHQWKRAHRQEITRLTQRLDAMYFPLLHPLPADTDFPDDLMDWLNALTRLESVPFSYLIPDERLLRAESLRFFVVDPAWLECLRDGAMSIGRVLAADHLADHAHTEQLDPLPRVSGFLLRSSVVSAWPTLGVRGYACPDEPDNKWHDDSHLDGDASYQELPIWRMSRLAPDLLLCMFYDPQDEQREINLLELHIPPQVLHFGVEHNNDSKYKALRDINTRNELKVSISLEPYWRKNTGQSEKVLDLWSLSQEMGSHNEVKTMIETMQQAMDIAVDGSRFTSADFALQMLDSPPLIRFLRSEEAA